MKIACAVGIMCKLKYYLPQNAILKLYYALVRTHLNYGILIWGNTYSSYLSKLNNYKIKHTLGKKFDHGIMDKQFYQLYWTFISLKI